MTKITARSLTLFMAYVRDIENWDGAPLVGANVGGSPEDGGNLTQLKRAELVKTFTDSDGLTWLRFTPAGVKLAAEHGVEIMEFPRKTT
jgi:hypothetical protein